MEVLSQDEIDQLLTAINAGDTEPEDFRPAADSRKIKIYDFKRPDKFSKEQIRTMSIIHETFARLTTAVFSTYLRNMTHVHVASVDQLTYQEFIRSIPTPTTLGVIEMAPLGGIIMEIDPAISFSMIGRLFGGDGDQIKHQHELTDMENLVMREIINKTLPNLRDAWATIANIKPKLVSIETNPQFIQLVPPTEMTVLITLETKTGDVEGMMNICFPYLALETVMPKLSTQFWYSPGKSKVSRNNIDINSIEISLAAELFRKNYRLGDALAWKVGETLYPPEGTDLTTCSLKIDDLVFFKAEMKFSKESHPMYNKKVTVTQAVKPYKERIMEVPSKSPIQEALQDANLEISVELGRTKKLVKDILQMGEGTIVELDKLAGEPVDILVNRKLIAKGEVVVIDENFGVRITEICEGSRVDE